MAGLEILKDMEKLKGSWTGTVDAWNAQFDDKYNTLETKYTEQLTVFDGWETSFETKYNGLEAEYAGELTDVNSQLANITAEQSLNNLNMVKQVQTLEWEG